jgi:hypothetical protein
MGETEDARAVTSAIPPDRNQNVSPNGRSSPRPSVNMYLPPLDVDEDEFSRCRRSDQPLDHRSDREHLRLSPRQHGRRQLCPKRVANSAGSWKYSFSGPTKNNPSTTVKSQDVIYSSCSVEATNTAGVAGD